MFDPWVGSVDSLEKEMQPTTVFCLGNLMDREAWCGYSPWGLKRLGHDLETKQQQCKTLMNKIKEELNK